MIENERQYRITKAWIQKMTRTLAEMEASGEGDRSLSVLQKAEWEALASQREALRREIRQYEALRTRDQ